MGIWIYLQPSQSPKYGLHHTIQRYYIVPHCQEIIIYVTSSFSINVQDFLCFGAVTQPEVRRATFSGLNRSVVLKIKSLDVQVFHVHLCGFFILIINSLSFILIVFLIFLSNFWVALLYLNFVWLWCLLNTILKQINFTSLLYQLFVHLVSSDVSFFFFCVCVCFFLKVRGYCPTNTLLI